MRPTDGVVMDEDNLDIYGDLNEGTHKKSTLPGGAPSLDDTLNDEALLYNELNSLEVEVKALRKDRKSLAEENATLKSSLTAKERQIQVLRNNISSLYKTAKLELERRSQELADVRREYDSLVFRRRTSQLDSAFQSVEPSISTVNVSTDTSDLISSKCHNPLSTKENQSRRREEYSNYSQPAEASKEGKRKSPLSPSQEINQRKVVKYASSSTPRSSGYPSESSRYSRKERPSTEPHYRSHSRYSDSHYHDRQSRGSKFD